MKFILVLLTCLFASHMGFAMKRDVREMQKEVIVMIDLDNTFLISVFEKDWSEDVHLGKIREGYVYGGEVTFVVGDMEYTTHNYYMADYDLFLKKLVAEGYLFGFFSDSARFRIEGVLSQLQKLTELPEEHFKGNYLSAKDIIIDPNDKTLRRKDLNKVWSLSAFKELNSEEYVVILLDDNANVVVKGQEGQVLLTGPHWFYGESKEFEQGHRLFLSVGMFKEFMDGFSDNCNREQLCEKLLDIVDWAKSCGYYAGEYIQKGREWLKGQLDKDDGYTGNGSGVMETSAKKSKYQQKEYH